MEENNDFFEEPTNMGEEISQEETKLARGGAPRQKIKKAKILNILLAVGIGANPFGVVLIEHCTADHHAAVGQLGVKQAHRFLHRGNSGGHQGGKAHKGSLLLAGGL